MTKPISRWFAAIAVGVAVLVAFMADPSDDAPQPPGPRPAPVAQRAEPAYHPLPIHSQEAEHRAHHAPPVVAGRYHRARDEWQGMLQAEGDVWPCVDGTCTQARACVDGACMPCVADAECQRAELCVLGLCVDSEQADCQSRADCQDEELCVLSGLTSMDPRGNRDMWAKCLAPAGGVEPTPQQVAEEVADRHAQVRANPLSDPYTPSARALELIRKNRDPSDDR